MDKAGQRARLPQYNWGSPELQAEMKRVVRFWMDTGSRPRTVSLEVRLPPFGYGFYLVR